MSYTPPTVPAEGGTDASEIARAQMPGPASYKPEMPTVHVSVYGTGRDKPVPDAARYGKGTSTVEGAQKAADARRAQTPGDHEK